MKQLQKLMKLSRFLAIDFVEIPISVKSTTAATTVLKAPEPIVHLVAQPVGAARQLSHLPIPKLTISQIITDLL